MRSDVLYLKTGCSFGAFTLQCIIVSFSILFNYFLLKRRRKKKMKMKELQSILDSFKWTQENYVEYLFFSRLMGHQCHLKTKKQKKNQPKRNARSKQ